MDREQIVAEIDQKALGLSALLRQTDNDFIQMTPEARELLDGSLEMLSWRVAATRALLHSSISTANDVDLQLTGAAVR